MLYARVVLGAPVEGPFDYIVPTELRQKMRAGQRVTVSFGWQKKTGYVVKLSSRSAIKNLKPVLKLLDETPLLSENMLLLTREMSRYYYCSWGEAIESALPQGLRQGRMIALSLPPFLSAAKIKSVGKTLLAEALESGQRWDKVYLPKIRETVDRKQSVIVLFPDTTYLSRAEAVIKADVDCRLVVLYRNRPDELSKWISIRESKADVVIGTRSAVFAPLDNLGLIIIDEENTGFGYKQDQSPHYDARQISRMRSRIDSADLILGGATLSLESIYAAERNEAEYLRFPPSGRLPEVKIVDTKGIPLINKKRKMVVSDYLYSAISENLPGDTDSKSRILLFYNRAGFATIASCPSCSAILKCRRCDVNLVFYYRENKLRCHRCNFEILPPKICPDCNANYIRYCGAGTEKIESEFSRLFPQAKIEEFDSRRSGSDADIFISNQPVMKESGLVFRLIAVLSADNLLNYVDFRASEKTFALFYGLIALTDNKIVIQTGLPGHYVFRALADKNNRLLYKEELKTRKQLRLPPYRCLALVKLRGKNEEKVKETSRRLFESMNGKGVETVSLNPGCPSKLRGNFYRQILIKSRSAVKITEFLKKTLRKFSHPGVIIAVDIDPI